jgi:hypothetical protein
MRDQPPVRARVLESQNALYTDFHVDMAAEGRRRAMIMVTDILAVFLQGFAAARRGFPA